VKIALQSVKSQEKGTRGILFIPLSGNPERRNQKQGNNVYIENVNINKLHISFILLVRSKIVSVFFHA